MGATIALKAATDSETTNAILIASCVIASWGILALGLARAAAMRPIVSGEHWREPTPEASLVLYREVHDMDPMSVSGL